MCSREAGCQSTACSWTVTRSTAPASTDTQLSGDARTTSILHQWQAVQSNSHARCWQIFPRGYFSPSEALPQHDSSALAPSQNKAPLTFTLRPGKLSSSWLASSITACSADSRVLYTMKPYLHPHKQYSTLQHGNVAHDSTALYTTLPGLLAVPDSVLACSGRATI